MPHHISSPTSIEQAFANIAEFLTLETAWVATAYDGNSKMSVYHPSEDQVGFSFSIQTQTISVSSYGSLSGEYVACEVSGPGVEDPFEARCTYISPLTRLFVHAGEDPSPWVLLTFETVPGYFHHLYFGYVEKLGVYSGGAIASGFVALPDAVNSTYFNQWCPAASSASTVFADNNYLFGANSAISSVQAPGMGGMTIDSPDAPATTYRFGGYEQNYFVGGGFTHAHNALLLAAGTSHIDGSVNAHPIVLHAQITGDRWQTPVAIVPGVRMINISDLAPAQVITLGGEFWQVFPLCNKDIPYGRAFAPPAGQGPGRFTPGALTDYPVNMGGATEYLGVAVRREP